MDEHELQAAGEAGAADPLLSAAAPARSGGDLCADSAPRGGPAEGRGGGGGVHGGSAGLRLSDGPRTLAPHVLDIREEPEATQVPTSICSEDMGSFPKVQPQHRVDVEFDDLEVSVRKSITSKERKTILHSVTGRFRAGELVGVMGPSGAGKTTLLNTISGYSAGDMTGGSLRMQHTDGRVVNDRRVCCYLTQDDHIQSWFTAREIVTHAADLKVGSKLSRKARALLVDDTLEALGLAGCRNTRASRLSGGQRKRLAIAAELVDNPTVLFFDEPTTGLDTSTATQCAMLMRRIARSGRAVICTIHQPSENILSLFDQLYVLAEGRCVFRGHPSNIIPFLSNLGFHCPKFHNPADFLIEVANNEYGFALDIMGKEVERRSSEYPPPLPDLQDFETPSKATQNGNTKSKLEIIGYENNKPSEWERFRVLVTRSLLQQHRDWVTTHLKLFSAISVALILGMMFGQLGDDASRVISNVGLLFIVTLYIIYTPEAPAVMKYPDEINVVKREWFNHWYHLTTYSFALLVSSLPMHVMTCTAMCSITYYMTGQLAEPLRFAQMTFVVILTSIASESVGLQWGSLFLKKKIVSLFIASTHLAYCILFSGFLALSPEMPEWFNWAAKSNHLHFALNGVVVALYKDRARLKCPEDVLYCHLREPTKVLETFGLENNFLWHNVLALVVIIILLRITGFLCLRYNVIRVNI